jgi:hypothetical protein
MALWDAKCERCACRRVRAAEQWVGAVGAEAVQQEAEVRRQAADRFGELEMAPYTSAGSTRTPTTPINPRLRHPA